MLGDKSAGLVIFAMINGLAVMFLLYALAHFWKEGHESKSLARSRNAMSGYGRKPKLVLVSAPVDAGTRREYNRLIRFPSQAGQQRGVGADLPERSRETSLVR
jgi:hypothetical protein